MLENLIPFYSEEFDLRGIFRLYRTVFISCSDYRSVQLMKTVRYSRNKQRSQILQSKMELSSQIDNPEEEIDLYSMHLLCLNIFNTSSLQKCCTCRHAPKRCFIKSTFIWHMSHMFEITKLYFKKDLLMV